MKKETAGHSERSAHTHKPAHKIGGRHEGSNTAETLMPPGSWQRVALGVAAAAGGGLIAVTVIGVGPAAVAGAAGYLAYRGLSGRRNRDESGQERRPREREGHESDKH